MTTQAQEMPQPARSLTLRSHYDFQTTVSRLEDALASRGLTLFADIDQSAAAVQAGTTLRPTRLFLFGNPKGGTPIMQANPHAALELPLRAVVWQDDQGGVHLDYQDISETLNAEYGLPAPLLMPLAQLPTLMGGVAGEQ